MQGFPVAQENRLPRPDWDRAPWNRWSFQHVREILPTVEVWRGEGKIWKLPRKPRQLDQIRMLSGDAVETTINDWLDTSYTDGFIVLHKRNIVYERYMNGMDERTLHLSQSMAKSIIGTVCGILVGRGVMDPEQKISHYLPELEDTAWRGATLRHVLDMTTGVRFIEDYEALDSDIAMTDIASGWKQARDGISAPAGIWEQILGLREATREHGTWFEYRSIETDVLAHAMERATQTRLAELVSRELWQPLGCESSACFTVDAAGYALADGGFNATLRDYARFGLAHAQGGRANGRQIIPGFWIEDTHHGDPTRFGEPYTFSTPNGAYRNQFWIEDTARRSYMARGVFGQMIYIDRDHEVVIVKLSSWPEFVSVERLKDALSAARVIIEALARK